jgi:hypothetical protein
VASNKQKSENGVALSATYSCEMTPSEVKQKARDKRDVFFRSSKN